MPHSDKAIDVYLEIGKSRIFAGAVEWPGWCRSGRDEAAALQALADYGPRYSRVVHGARLKFRAPADVSAFNVVERLEGDATTDFGAPGIPPSGDAGPLDEAEQQRQRAILKACWRAFDAASEAAKGKELRKGPRGGGRDREKIVRHLMESDRGYLRALGWKLDQIDGEALEPAVERTREAMIAGLAASVRGDIPAKGPRGGTRWTPRYFVRRTAWHALDHAWEIEDRSE
jgi:hypothetical protein